MTKAAASGQRSERTPSRATVLDRVSLRGVEQEIEAPGLVA